jgi:hypothetical protein
VKKSILLILLATVLVLSACGKNTNTTHENHDLANGEQHQLPNGDLQEVTASTDVLPSFLDDKPEDMRLVYQVAATATDIIEWMPCYCGCGESANHGSNLNCFIDEIREDGSVVWDDHSTRCQVCLDTAVDSVMMMQEGKSLKEIRTIIDETYKEGYAKPTDTPMPS